MKLAMAQMRMSASLQENLNEALQYMEQAAAAGIEGYTAETKPEGTVPEDTAKPEDENNG